MPEGEFRDCFAYQQQAIRTLGTVERRDGLAMTALGLAGEAGEVVELVKKHLFHGKPLESDKLAKELGDVLWYLAAACEVAGLDLGAVAWLNIDKLERRYPSGFNHADSAARRDLGGASL